MERKIYIIMKPLGGWIIEDINKMLMSIYEWYGFNETGHNTFNFVDLPTDCRSVLKKL